MITDQLFQCEEGYEQTAMGSFEFFNCKLLQPIGEYPSDTKFAVIVVDFNTGRLSLHKELYEADSGKEPVLVCSLFIGAQPLQVKQEATQ